MSDASDKLDKSDLSQHKRTRSHMSLARLSSTFSSRKDGDKNSSPHNYNNGHSNLSQEVAASDIGAQLSPSLTGSTSNTYFNQSPTSNSGTALTDSQSKAGRFHKKNVPSLTGSLGHSSSSSALVSNTSTSERLPLPFSASSASINKGSSIEDSVKTFRLFEALRNGDTGAIYKSIREASLKDTAGPEVHAVLHLAVQCAEPQVISYILTSTSRSEPEATEGRPFLDINYRDPATGNTALHFAATLGRAPVVAILLREPTINDAVSNAQGMQPVDVSRTADIAQELQLARSLYLEDKQNELISLVHHKDYNRLESFLEVPRTRAVLDLNSLDGGVPGSTLLHEAAKQKDLKLIQILLLHGADPFRRDRKGKLPQDVTKDEKTKSMLKKSPAAVAAQQSIQEKAVLGSGAGIPGADESHGREALNKEGREMKGYLKKWTNYTGGYKLRWFVLENGVLSYYKHQDDTESACRGAINMKIARLHADAQDKQKFEIHGKSSVRYHLKANHQVEAKRWIWALNSAIRHAKDEEKEEEHNRQKAAAQLQAGRAALNSSDPTTSLTGTDSSQDLRRTSVAASTTSVNRPKSEFFGSEAGSALHDPNASGLTEAEQVAMENDEDDDDNFDDSASHMGRDDAQSNDSFNLTAHSARLQLDLLTHVSTALQAEASRNPNVTISNANIVSALGSYDAAVKNLKSLMNELLKMNKERDSFWRHRLDREITLRNMWEENMTRLAVEQENLEGEISEIREKRKKTKRALREALKEGATPAPEGPKNLEQALRKVSIDESGSALRRKSIMISQEMSDSDSADASDEEFFDAVDAGEVEVARVMPADISSPKPQAADAEAPKKTSIIPSIADIIGTKETPVPEQSQEEKQLVAIKTSFKGYNHKPRFKFSKDQDDRPKVGLWGILKSMIGKDMTKMTLPVSFNECTSLLQRVAEDMEYTDLLDKAVERADSSERLVYVAAFAASEYASTCNRVAKPFNPLLGETYEYCRPDKNFRFFVEQVSHHPPIGAAWAEAPNWTYYGESSVRSKFYGKSFDFNPLGTWFLRIRPKNGDAEELYTWKKVNTSVVGIITGTPTVDNYGTMVVKNHTTGEVCNLDFKARGWRGAGAFEVKGRLLDASDTQRWSIGGRWNDKLYARVSPGYDAAIMSSSGRHESVSNAAFLVWEVHDRPSAPFNLTPFAISLNYLDPELKPHLCPTDTRLRPDQRAMEEGQYDFAASEKHRLEEKQRARRRIMEQQGEEYKPRWFTKSTCETTGEEFWMTNGEYWENRHTGEWVGVADIFSDAPVQGGEMGGGNPASS